MSGAILADLAEVLFLLDRMNPYCDEVASKFVLNHHAQIARDAEDASRYRFLRGPACPIDFTEMRWEAQDCMDQYIDTAMKSANGGDVVG